MNPLEDTYMSKQKNAFQELDLCNSFLFAAALEQPEICRLVLEIILGQDAGGQIPFENTGRYAPLQN